MKALCDLVQVGGDVWQLTGPSPQFELSALTGHALVEIEGVDAPVGVRVYPAGRRGYREDTAVEIAPAPMVRLCISFARLGWHRRVRIDPGDGPGAEGRKIQVRHQRFSTQQNLDALCETSPGPVPICVPNAPRKHTSRVFARQRFPITPRAFLDRREAARIERIWALADGLSVPVGHDKDPHISFVVPVYNTAPQFLADLLDSFQGQAPGAELILSDDGSDRLDTMSWLERNDTLPDVTVLRNGVNRGIAAATNTGIRAATGDWIGLLDHDDLLAPNAVAMVRKALIDSPLTEFLYTDEAIAGPALEARGLFLKPAFDPVLLSGVNYVNHLSIYRRDRLMACGLLNEGFEGSQDYELLLRYCRGLAPEQITHLPYPAYVWRQHEGSVSHSRLDEATAQARRALEMHFSHSGQSAVARSAPLLPNLHKVEFPRPDAAWPMVSIIIPNRNSPRLIETVLDGVLAHTDYPSLDVIVVDNGTTDHETLGIYKKYEADQRVRVDIREAPFNFSAMINRGVELARSDHFLLLNNDIEIEDPGWLKEMVGCLAHAGTGIVGAKLLYPDRTIQHAGVILGLGNLAGHWFYKQPERTTGPMGRLAVRNSMTIVTAAAMLITSACWRAAGRFDEERFQVAYNDVDFCARARAKGFGVIWTPHAQLIHHESASRGSDKTARNLKRFRAEQAALRTAHDTETFEDPAHNPWLSRFQSRPKLRMRTALPGPRHFMGFPEAPDE